MKIKYSIQKRQQAFELLSSGRTQQEAAKEIGISNKCWYRWIKEKPEFSLVVKEGMYLGFDKRKEGRKDGRN